MFSLPYAFLVGKLNWVFKNYFTEHFTGNFFFNNMHTMMLLKIKLLRKWFVKYISQEKFSLWFGTNGDLRKIFMKIVFYTHQERNVAFKYAIQCNLSENIFIADFTNEMFYLSCMIMHIKTKFLLNTFSQNCQFMFLVHN